MKSLMEEGESQTNGDDPADYLPVETILREDENELVVSQEEALGKSSKQEGRKESLSNFSTLLHEPMMSRENSPNKMHWEIPQCTSIQNAATESTSGAVPEKTKQAADKDQVANAQWVSQLVQLGSLPVSHQSEGNVQIPSEPGQQTDMSMLSRSVIITSLLLPLGCTHETRTNRFCLSCRLEASDKQRKRRMDPSYREQERQRQRTMMKMKRQDPMFRALEREKQRSRMQARRRDPNFREHEREKQRMRMKIKRQDPAFRERERERQKSRMQMRRQDPAFKARERARDRSRMHIRRDESGVHKENPEGAPVSSAQQMPKGMGGGDKTLPQPSVDPAAAAAPPPNAAAMWPPGIQQNICMGVSAEGNSAGIQESLKHSMLCGSLNALCNRNSSGNGPAHPVLPSHMAAMGQGNHAAGRPYHCDVVVTTPNSVAAKLLPGIGSLKYSGSYVNGAPMGPYAQRPFTGGIAGSLAPLPAKNINPNAISHAKPLYFQPPVINNSGHTTAPSAAGMDVRQPSFKNSKERSATTDLTEIGSTIELSHSNCLQTGLQECPTCKQNYLPAKHISEQIKVYSRSTGTETQGHITAETHHQVQTNNNFDNVQSQKGGTKTTPGIGPFHCSKCGAMLQTLSGYKYHERTHSGDLSFKCDNCGKGYSNKGSYVRHIKQHSDRYECSVCSKTFRMKQHLKEHMKSHGDKNLSCPHCYYRTCYRYALSRHIAIRHTNHGTHVCSACGESFKYTHQLQRHQQQCKRKETLVM